MTMVGSFLIDAASGSRNEYRFSQLLFPVRRVRGKNVFFLGGSGKKMF